MMRHEGIFSTRAALSGALVAIFLSVPACQTASPTPGGAAGSGPVVGIPSVGSSGAAGAGGSGGGSSGSLAGTSGAAAGTSGAGPVNQPGGSGAAHTGLQANGSIAYERNK
jgi:hypothetical protein